MRNVSVKSFKENQKAHFMLNRFFFSESYPLSEEVEKYCTSGQARDDNIAHAHFMLDTEGYKHTLTECVIFIAFPLQQSLHERATMSRYTYITSHVFNEI
jgi:hypothetical protein